MDDITNSNNFSDVINLIKQARANAYKAVNTELINLNWEIGKYTYLNELISKAGENLQ